MLACLPGDKFLNYAEGQITETANKNEVEFKNELEKIEWMKEDFFIQKRMHLSHQDEVWIYTWKDKWKNIHTF
jgi:hypothetical protein